MFCIIEISLHKTYVFANKMESKFVEYQIKVMKPYFSSIVSYLVFIVAFFGKNSFA
jgi:hypothetical protein